MQGVTAEQTGDRPHQPAGYAVFLECLGCIFRARWSKTARRRQPWRDNHFVQLENSDSDGAGGNIHNPDPNRPRSSAFKSPKGLSRAERLGLITQSNRSEERR